jgi:DNA-binding response OmpR family regulator
MPNRTRILILDDEVALLNTLTDYLRECRYTVYPVTQAEEASAHLRCGIVDLAILDVGAHGLRIAREAATNDIPTILISGHPVILETGAVGDVMRKPFGLAVLRANIEKTLAKHSRDGSEDAESPMAELADLDLPRIVRSGSA